MSPVRALLRHALAILVLTGAGGAGCADEVNCREFPSTPPDRYFGCSKSSECTLVDIPDVWAAQGFPIHDATYCSFPIAEKYLERYERQLLDFIAVCGEKRSPPGTIAADCVTGFENSFPLCRDSECSQGELGGSNTWTDELGTPSTRDTGGRP